MKPHETIGFLVKVIHDAVGVKANSQLEEFDLTLQQMRVLRFLSRRQGEPACHRDCEAHFHVTHPTMIGILQRLESKGFIQTTINTRDKRLRDVHLTAKADEVLAAVHNHIRETEDLMLRGLTPEEIAQLTDLLNRVYRNIREG